MTLRKEMILVAVGLVVLAALILYRALELHAYTIRSDPQTTVQTTSDTQMPSRSRYAVDVNRATFDELMGVRGMTETIANGILEYRKEIGRFYSYEELLQVPGVGKKTLENLRPYLVLDEYPQTMTRAG